VQMRKSGSDELEEPEVMDCQESERTLLRYAPLRVLVPIKGLAWTIRWYCCAKADTTPFLVSSDVEYILGKLGSTRALEPFDSVINVIIVCCNLITYPASSALPRSNHDD
jgi:hypothetical protein